jgi:hypothetical protein
MITIMKRLLNLIKKNKIFKANCNKVLALKKEALLKKTLKLRVTLRWLTVKDFIKELIKEEIELIRLLF